MVPYVGLMVHYMPNAGDLWGSAGQCVAAVITSIEYSTGQATLNIFYPGRTVPAAVALFDKAKKPGTWHLIEPCENWRQRKASEGDDDPGNSWKIIKPTEEPLDRVTRLENMLKNLCAIVEEGDEALINDAIYRARAFLGIPPKKQTK